MGEVTFNIAAAFGVQSVLGTADATIAALTTSVDETDGLVLGDPESGIGESGIDFAIARSLREKADVSPSFTKQPSDFIGESIETFEISWALKGNGATATPSAGEAIPDPGIDALLQACGLTGANGTAPDYVYTPAASQIITAKVWVNGMAWVVKDIVGSLSIDFPPGSVAVATATLAGVIDSFAVEAIPTLDFGNQGTLSAPSVAEVGHNWGISAASRGFSTATLGIDSGTQDVPDSNAEAGNRTRQTSRTITMEATIFGDDGDIDFERAELVRTTAPTEPQTFTVGTPAGAADTINAITVLLANPETRSAKPNKLGASYAIDVSLVAVDESANGEFTLTFE